LSPAFSRLGPFFLLLCTKTKSRCPFFSTFLLFRSVVASGRMFRRSVSPPLGVSPSFLFQPRIVYTMIPLTRTVPYSVKTLTISRLQRFASFPLPVFLSVRPFRGHIRSPSADNPVLPNNENWPLSLGCPCRCPLSSQWDPLPFSPLRDLTCLDPLYLDDLESFPLVVCVAPPAPNCPPGFF